MVPHFLYCGVIGHNHWKILLCYTIDTILFTTETFTKLGSYIENVCLMHPMNFGAKQKKAIRKTIQGAVQ